MRKRYNLDLLSTAWVWMLLICATSHAQLEWRVSVKFILDENDQLPTRGNLRTHEAALEQFEFANALLDSYGRGYRFVVTLEDDLTDLPGPPWFCDGGGKDNAECNPDNGNDDCQHPEGNGFCQPLVWHWHGGQQSGKECVYPNDTVWEDVGECRAGVCVGGTFDGRTCDAANSDEDCHNLAGDSVCEPLDHWYDAPFVVSVRKYLDRAAEDDYLNEANVFKYRPDAINVYILHSRRGGLSVQPPWGTGLLLGQSGGVTTPFHEVGHFFSLCHTQGCGEHVQPCEDPDATGLRLEYPCGAGLAFVAPAADEFDDTLPTVSCWCLEDLAMYSFCMSFGPPDTQLDPKACDPPYDEPVLSEQDKQRVLDTFHNVMGYQANSELRVRMTPDQLDKMTDVSNNWRHKGFYPDHRTVDVVSGCTHFVDADAAGGLIGINTCGQVPVCQGGPRGGEVCDHPYDCYDTGVCREGECAGGTLNGTSCDVANGDEDCHNPVGDGVCRFRDGSSNRPYPTVGTGLAGAEDSGETAILLIRGGYYLESHGVPLIVDQSITLRASRGRAVIGASGP